MSEAQTAAEELAKRRCSRCHEVKAFSAFATGQNYCRPCKADYNADRLQALAILPEALAPAVYPTPPVGSDDALRGAIADYFRAYGFTRLRITTEALIVDLSKKKRVELAREGWIA